MGMFLSIPLELGFPLCHWYSVTPAGWSPSWLFPVREWRSSGLLPSEDRLQGLSEGGMSVSSTAGPGNKKGKKLSLFTDERNTNISNIYIYKLPQLYSCFHSVLNVLNMRRTGIKRVNKTYIWDKISEIQYMQGQKQIHSVRQRHHLQNWHVILKVLNFYNTSIKKQSEIILFSFTLHCLFLFSVHSVLSNWRDKKTILFF